MVFSLFFLINSACAVPSDSKSLKVTNNTSTSCDSVVYLLSRRKVEYFSRINNTNSAEGCFEVADEEWKEPFSVPVSCQYKKFKDLSTEARDGFIGIGTGFDGDFAIEGNEKVTSAVSMARKKIHEMFMAKCEDRNKDNKLKQKYDQENKTSSSTTIAH